MKLRSVLLVILALLVLPATAAHAQERGQAGLVMGYPGTIGLLWHASDRIALRPELDFDFISTDGDSELIAESSGRAWSAGASLLFYGPQTDNVRTYWSPRVTFGKGTTESNGNEGPTTNAWSASGSFGAQYAPVSRFSVFGEVGLAYSRSSVDTSVLGITVDRTSSSVGVRTAVGVVVYFGG